MTYEAEHHVRSVLVGDLRLPPEDVADQVQVDPGEKVPMLVELNLRYPGGLDAVRRAFYALWEQYADRAGGSWPAEPTSVSPVPRRRAGDGRPRPQLRPGERPSPGHLPNLAGLHLDAPDRPFGADREGR